MTLLGSYIAKLNEFQTCICLICLFDIIPFKYCVLVYYWYSLLEYQQQKCYDICLLVHLLWIHSTAFSYTTVTLFDIIPIKYCVLLIPLVFFTRILAAETLRHDFCIYSGFIQLCFLTHLTTVALLDILFLLNIVYLYTTGVLY